MGTFRHVKKRLAKENAPEYAPWKPAKQNHATPVLNALERNALAVDVPVQQRALYWKTFAKLQLEVLRAGELVEPNAMTLTLSFDGPDGKPLRTVTYRRVTAEEFARLSEKTPRHVESIARPGAANDDAVIRQIKASNDG